MQSEKVTIKLEKKNTFFSDAIVLSFQTAQGSVLNSSLPRMLSRGYLAQL